jgi:alpha-1,6-mannosyltransferase
VRRARSGDDVRIVRLANFVTGSSGGLRTALYQLGVGYLAAGHDPVLVVPGARHDERETAQGLVVTVPGPVVPGTGGYRVLLNRPAIGRLLARLRPDRLEASDRLTLRWTGGWAGRRDIPAMMVSHESLDGLLRLLDRRIDLRAVADRLNARTAAGFDRVVCTTSWAAAEFDRLGVDNLIRVPLGVDLSHFRPERHDARLRAAHAGPNELLLVHCGRLSPEKRPERSLAALAELRRRGFAAVLVVVGDGPRRAALVTEARRRDLPATFLSFIADRDHLAGLLAAADVVIAPGPVETFGLAALEALASGTPVVVAAESALPEVVGAAGIAAAGDGPAYADAILELLDRPDRRLVARQQAERYPWAASVAGFLAAHGLTPAAAASSPTFSGPAATASPGQRTTRSR